MAEMARIGAPTDRSGPIYTDSSRVIRRIGYGVWRFTTGDIRMVKRYVGFGAAWVRWSECAWFSGGVYQSIYACLASALEVCREDIYVEHSRAGCLRWENVSSYSRFHGVNLGTVCSLIVEDLVACGALELQRELLGLETWFLSVEDLDAWVASRLIALPEQP